MTKPSIENLWDQLDPKAQEWLRANPGSVILPRSVTGALVRASGRRDGLEGIDSNGQLPLSPEDQAFLKTMAGSAPVGHPVPPATPSL